MKWTVVGGLAGVAGVVWAIFAYVVPPDDDKPPVVTNNSEVNKSIFGPMKFDISVGAPVTIKDQLVVQVNTVTDDSADIGLSTNSASCTVHISDGGAGAKIKNGPVQFSISFSGSVPDKKLTVTVSAGVGSNKQADAGVCT